MHQNINKYLVSLDWTEKVPPVVDFNMYFLGNTEEECIAPNQWGCGRPPIAELYAKLKEIAVKPGVEKVLVGLHSDWDDPVYAEGFPPGENIHILTSASKHDVESWIDGLGADGVIKGWPYGKPRNAPEPSKGYSVYSICWD